MLRERGWGRERGGLWKGGLAEQRCCGEIGERREKVMPTATPHKHTKGAGVNATAYGQGGRQVGREGGDGYLDVRPVEWFAS